VPDLLTSDRFPDGPIAAAWEDLVARDPAATVFHRARFLRLWCRYLRGRCDLRLRFVLADGAGPEHERLIGVVPEVRERTADGRRSVHFAGGEHVTDYLGPVSRPEHRAGVVDAWLTALLDEADWDELTAGGMAGDAGWDELLVERAARSGVTVAENGVQDVCPRVDLSGGWEAYLERITGKQRHEIRRKARKLARESGVVKLVAVDAAELDAAIDTFVALHRTSAGEKGRFFVDDRRAAFFHALASEFGDEGTLRVHRLDVDAQPAAVTLSLVWGRRPEWGLYNSAFERGLASLAPGMVLVGELLRIAGEEGCQVFDLLRGDEAYKYRFGAEARPVHRVVIRREADGVPA
jgi:CelD/BcsL family acetyltransferase involved in cellulose biosynthesis